MRTLLLLSVIFITSCATDNSKSPATENIQNLQQKITKNHTERLALTVSLVREERGDQILFLEDGQGKRYTALSTIGYNSKQKFKKGDKVLIIPQNGKVVGSGDKSFSMLVSKEIRLFK